MCKEEHKEIVKALKDKKKIAKSINTEEMDDARLASLIEKGLKTKSVSRKAVMELLG